MTPLYILPNGDAITLATVGSVMADIGCSVEGKNYQPKVSMEIGRSFGGAPIYTEVKCETYEEACAIRDKIISDRNELTSELMGDLVVALERLGSMEAFDVARPVDISRDQELMARIKYVRDVLDKLDVLK